jgi:adenylate cyclase
MEWACLDQGLRWRSDEGTDPRILIVAITEADLRQQKQWPLSDQVLAQLIKRIRAGDPAAIGLDIYRDFSVAPGQTALHQTLITTPQLIGIHKVLSNGTGATILPPPALDAKDQVGSNDLLIDPDGKMRRILLHLPAGDQIHDSFSLRLADLFFTRHGIEPDLAAPVLTWNGHRFPPFEGNDGGYVRANASAHQMLINYRQASLPFEQVTLGDVLLGQVPGERFRDRVVLIGTTARSLNDRFLTPYSTGHQGFSTTMAGVEIHAHGVSQLLAAVMDDRSPLRIWADGWELWWITSWSVLGAGLTWRWRSWRLAWYWRSGILLLLGLGLMVGCLVALNYGWWVPLVPALFGFAGSSFAVTGYGARTAGEIRQIFGRYLSDAVVTELLESPGGLKLGGERRLVTILMSDLRGFTSASAQQPPEVVLAFLNEYLAVMTEVIGRYEGTIDEFLGDSILVMFGAPVQRGDDATRAVACALAMQRAMAQVYARTEQWGLPTIEMGIAIHSGESVVGNIGSTKRAKYGLVGSSINLTSRIESYSVGGQVLISEATRLLVVSPLQLRHHVDLQAKGFSETIAIYTVEGLGSPYDLLLPMGEADMVILSAAISVRLSLIEGKQVMKDSLEGAIVQVSQRQAVVWSVVSLERFVNLKIMVKGMDWIYGKVIEEHGDRDCYIVRFTFLPDSVLAFLKNSMREP